MTVSNEEFEVSGREVLVSEHAKQLFEQGKIWATKHWAKEGRQVTKIHIEKKSIGRNAGFIMCVSISKPSVIVRYFAKIQTVHIETVIIHYLLKYTNSGPEAFLVVVLPSNNEGSGYRHGVITLEVPNFKMSSQLTVDETVELGEQRSFIQAQSFLLSLFNELGHFANIPGNRDNWGFVGSSSSNSEGVQKPFERLALVDFSSVDQRKNLYEKAAFYLSWRSIHSRYFPQSEQVGTTREQLEIQDQLKHFPWLRSQRAFKAMLQKAMDSTEAWLNRTWYKHAEAGTSTICANKCCCGGNWKGALLSSFKTTPRLCICSNQLWYIEDMWYQYESWVLEWDEQCHAVCRWMPFPRPTKVKYPTQQRVARYRSHLRRRQVKYTYVV